MQTLYVLTHEWLASASHRSRDFAQVDVAGGQRLQSGTVLGRVTATGRLKAHSDAASDGSQTAVALLGTALMDGVAGTFGALVFANDCSVFPGALNGGAGISPTTAAQLASRAVRLLGPNSAALPGAGAGVGEVTLDLPPTPTVPTTLAPTINGTPAVGVTVTFSPGFVTGFPSPTVTFVVRVGGVVKAQPYVPVLGDVGQTLDITQTATNSEGSDSATASATVVDTIIAPTVTSAPVINGTPTVGIAATYTAAVFGGSASTVTRQWTLDGADISGATGATYTPVATGALRVRETATNASGSVSSTSALITVQAAPVVDTRPRLFVAPANAHTTNTQALLTGSTPLAGSANGGTAGTFSLTTTAGNYGWVAVLASASAAGVHFFDGLGFGGWSGAGLAGNNTGASPDPSTSTTTFTDSGGTTWRLFRQDFVNANPTAASYTLS